jgi:hypothetical protein
MKVMSECIAANRIAKLLLCRSCPEWLLMDAEIQAKSDDFVPSK